MSQPTARPQNTFTNRILAAGQKVETDTGKPGITAKQVRMLCDLLHAPALAASDRRATYNWLEGGVSRAHAAAIIDELLGKNTGPRRHLPALEVTPAATPEPAPPIPAPEEYGAVCAACELAPAGEFEDPFNPGQSVEWCSDCHSLALAEV